MNGELFDLYVKTQLAPTLQSGDVIILDNLSPHKSPTAAAALKAVGAGFRFRATPSTGRLCCPSNLPPYSPDLNPIELAFAKLKALIQRAAARTYDELWQAVGQVCDLFTEEECYNFFKAAGSETDRTQHALGRGDNRGRCPPHPLAVQGNVSPRDLFEQMRGWAPSVRAGPRGAGPRVGLCAYLLLAAFTAS